MNSLRTKEQKSNHQDISAVSVYATPRSLKRSHLGCVKAFDALREGLHARMFPPALVLALAPGDMLTSLSGLPVSACTRATPRSL